MGFNDWSKIVEDAAHQSTRRTNNNAMLATNKATVVQDSIVANNTLIDSLPYIDDQYEDPAMQAKVAKLIKQEQSKFPMDAKAYLEPFPNHDVLFKDNVLLQAEYKRVVAAHKAGTLLDVVNTRDSYSKLDRSKIDLMYEEGRYINLELKSTYGSRMLKGHVNHVTKSEDLFRSILARAQEAGKNVNMERKRDQELNAAKLLNLTRKRFALYKSNSEIQSACEELEREIKKLKSKK